MQMTFLNLEQSMRRSGDAVFPLVNLGKGDDAWAVLQHIVKRIATMRKPIRMYSALTQVRTVLVYMS